ncbi:MAG: TetR/AcrR family transcriptional regulator [Ilumatobacteraceae bacterium]
MSGQGDAVRRERPGKAAIMRAAVTVMGEDGYEGASMRDMAARAGVSVAALYYHFPSKHDLLREFLDEAYDVLVGRLERRLAEADPAPFAQLDEVVSTLIASYLHDDFAQMAANVALRDHSRLDAPERAVIDAKRGRLLEITEGIMADGTACGAFAVDDTRESARVVVTLCSSLVEPFPHMGRSLGAVIELYQGFARAIALAARLEQENSREFSSGRPTPP